MAAVVDAPPSRRIKELEVMVADVVIETPDTCTLVFFTGNDHLEYRAGHFLTIDPHQFDALDRFTAFLEDLKGKKEPPRAYSMCSSPHERYLAVTVKEEQYVSGSTKYPPLLSPMLVKRTVRGMGLVDRRDRKSTRLNSSHLGISYAVFCLKKKKKKQQATVTA